MEQCINDDQKEGVMKARRAKRIYGDRALEFFLGHQRGWSCVEKEHCSTSVIISVDLILIQNISVCNRMQNCFWKR